MHPRRERQTKMQHGYEQSCLRWERYALKKSSSCYSNPGRDGHARLSVLPHRNIRFPHRPMYKLQCWSLLLSLFPQIFSVLFRPVQKIRNGNHTRASEEDRMPGRRRHKVQQQEQEQYTIVRAHTQVGKRTTHTHTHTHTSHPVQSASSRLFLVHPSVMCCSVVWLRPFYSLRLFASRR